MPDGRAPRLSGLVIAKNEAGNIDRCLASLAFCDEIVVVDAESEDDTVERARRYTERVFVEPWRGYGAQKNLALSLCRAPWIFWIDADEAASPELAEEIGRLLADPTGIGGPSDRSAYRVRRRVHYLGAWIRFGSFGNDWVTRLFRRDRGRFTEVRVHEELRVEGSVGKLRAWIGHWSYRDRAHHLAKIESMSELWALDARAAGRRATALDLRFRPVLRWLRMLVLEGGLGNGWRGFVIAQLGAHYVRRKYERLRALEERSG